MKKKIILLFLFVLASFSGWAQYSVSITTPITGGVIGSSIQVDFVYSAPAPCNIFAGIGLQNADWSPVSYVGGNGAPGNTLPAGENLTGTIYITIPAGTTPTANLTGGQNYKISITISDAGWAAQGGEWPATELNFTAPEGPPVVTPAVSFTSVPTSTQVGTNLVVNYKYSAPTAGGKVAILVSKNGGVNPWDFISTVVYDELTPTVAGTDVTGSFNLAIPGDITPTSGLTGNENYRIQIELLDSGSNWLAGNYDNTNYNFTAAPVVPAITFNPVVTASQVGSTLVVNYKYTSSVPVNIFAGINKFVNDVYDSSIPGGNSGGVLPAGTDLTGSISFPIPEGTVPTNGTNPHYKLAIQLSDSSWSWLAEQTENITLTASTAPAISFTSIPTSTEVGTMLTVNYKYTIAAAGNIFCGINLLNDWTFVSYVGGQGLSPAPAGTDVTGSFNILIPSGTTPTASLTGLQNYKINIVLSDSSWVTLAGDYPATQLNFTAPTYNYYTDADNDGYGAGSVVSLTSPTAPSGYSVNDDDCDDSNATVYPNATEIYDIIDNDCDGSVDEGAALPSSLTFCKGATVAFAKGTTDLTLYTSTSVTAVALSGTTALSSKLYFATLNGSARTAVSVTVNPLPATVASLTTSDAVLCKHIGTSNEVTYTAAPGASSYNWTVPANVTIVGGAGTNALTVNFSSSLLANIVGSLGSIGVKAVDGNGCISATAKTIALTTKLPTAPTSLTLTSGDTTDHFSMKIPLSDPVAYFTSLSDLTSGIKKVGPYMGTETVFTLTAPEAPTAASYEWTLPSGVNLSGVGNGRIITVDFADVAPGIVSLPIVVKSVGGCGLSSARTLNLLRALPTAPTKLVLTDGITETAITKVGPYTGKSTVLTLTATPFTTQGGTATSYAWKLPPGVVCTSTHTTGATLTGSTVIETVLTPWTITDAIATATSTITIDFSGAATAGVLTFPLSVYAVNGTGNSKARTLTVTAAVPTSPAITAVGGTTFNSCNTKTYSVVQTPGTSYAWTVPAGASSVLTGNSIVVDYTLVDAAIGATAQVTCVASNGTGSSAPKLLNVKRVACPPARLSDVADDFSVTAYPNPSSDVFNIDVQSSDKGTTGVQVYDMAGRLIESRQAKSNSVEVGRNYASGIYNVKVNKGAQVKTLRVIKK